MKKNTNCTRNVNPVENMVESGGMSRGKYTLVIKGALVIRVAAVLVITPEKKAQGTTALM